MNSTAHKVAAGLATWPLANRIVDRLSSRFHICFSLMGLGFARACLGWMLLTVRQADYLPAAVLSGHNVFDLAEMAGIAAIAFLSMRLSPVAGKPAALVCPTAMLGAGCVLLFLACAYSSSVCFYLGALLGGVGYAALLVLWLELYGCLRQRDMVLAYSCSYLVNLFLWFSLREVSAVCVGLAVTCGFCSAVMLFLGYRWVVPAFIPKRPAVLSDVSWRMLAWLFVFAFGYGVGDSITGVGYATMLSKVGMAVPAIIVVVGLFSTDRFDLSSIYITVFAFMLVGFAGVVLGSYLLPGLRVSVISPMLMSAANEGYGMLAAIMACSAAREAGTSSALYFGLLTLSSLAATQLGEAAGVWAGSLQAVGPVQPILLLSILNVALVVVACLFLFRWREISEKASLRKSEESLTKKILLDEARSHGLTTREQMVLLQIARGKTYAEIGEELFISPSAVRSHAGIIYRKFGVHSRVELEVVIGSLGVL